MNKLSRWIKSSIVNIKKIKIKNGSVNPTDNKSELNQKSKPEKYYLSFGLTIVIGKSTQLRMKTL
jgi:hypothetical protein